MDSTLFRKYVKNVEKRIEPKKVSIAYQGAEFLKKLPLFIQKRLLEAALKKIPIWDLW